VSPHWPPRQDKHITKDVFEQTSLAGREAIEALPNLDLLPQRRTVELRYRGTPFECKVSSPLEELSLKLSCYIRGLAVEKGSLKPLWVEDQLIPFGFTMGKGTVDRALLEEAKVARALAESLVRDQGHQSADLIAEVIRVKANTLTSLDRLFKIELQFMKEMLGSAGERRLLEEILKLMPSEQNKVSLEAGHLMRHGHGWTLCLLLVL